MRKVDYCWWPWQLPTPRAEADVAREAMSHEIGYKAGMSDSVPPPEDRRREDERELRRFGYAQELFRTMGGFSNFAISFSIISILTGAVTLYQHGLLMGGPAEMAFGWPLVAFFTMAVALSMAELASSVPTSGAMYHWASLLGGNCWGWFTAWFNITGQLAAIAGIDYGAAIFVTPLLGLPMTTTNMLMVYAGILISHALLNHIGITLVARLNDLSVTVHIVGVIAIVGALTLFAPKQPSTYVLRADYFEQRRLAVLVGVRRRDCCRRSGPSPVTTPRRACPKRPSIPDDGFRGAS